MSMAAAPAFSSQVTSSCSRNKLGSRMHLGAASTIRLRQNDFKQLVIRTKGGVRVQAAAVNGANEGEIEISKGMYPAVTISHCQSTAISPYSLWIPGDRGMETTCVWMEFPDTPCRSCRFFPSRSILQGRSRHSPMETQICVQSKWTWYIFLHCSSNVSAKPQSKIRHLSFHHQTRRFTRQSSSE